MSAYTDDLLEQIIVIIEDIVTALTVGFATAGAITTSSATGGVGYATGAGGTVTQGTDKSTTVVLDKSTGAITMHAASLNASTTVSFTVTSSAVGINDAVIVNHASTGTLGSYLVQAHTIAAGSFKISVRNLTAGSLGEALVLRYTVIKGVAS